MYIARIPNRHSPPAHLVNAEEAFEIRRSTPHGHAAAVLGTAKKLGLDRIIADRPSRQRNLVMAMIVARVLRPGSKLAAKHLRDGSLVLYDLSSSYYTGRCCTLALFGHNRDGKYGFPQINYGLLCDRDGRPPAIEVFEGNTADPAGQAAACGQGFHRPSSRQSDRRSGDTLEKPGP
jgi:hypothetical protein